MLRRSKRKLTLNKNSSHNELPTKRKHYSNSEISDNDSFDEDNNSSGDEFVLIQSTENKNLCTLNLSESESDNEAQDYKKTKAKQLQLSDIESEEDEICQTNFDFTNFLNSQNDTKITETEMKSQPVNTTNVNGYYDNMDVAKILSVGEGVNLKTVLNNTDNNTKEESKRDDNYSIPDMVEVNIKLPNDIKCKKGQDMQNLLRRRMNTICKETQILIHKVNLLLWISYGNNLNGVINSPEVMGSALSLIPSEKAYPPKQCDLNYLENYIAWFSKKIKISSKSNPLSEITILSLVEKFSNRKAETRFDLIVMFISMLRSLGLYVRLVININAVPIKPTSEQLLGPLIDENDQKPSSSKSKVKMKQKTPANSEYFNTKSNKLKDNSRKSNKNSKQSENISSTDEEEDTIFVKTNKKRSEYFKMSKLQIDVNKSTKQKSKPVFDKIGKNKSIISQKIDRRVLSTDEEDNITLTENNETKTKKKIRNDFWVEVFLEMEEKWFCVDVISQRLHCIKEIYVSYSVLLIYFINMKQSIGL